MGKQRKGEKCPDTGGIQTRDSGSGGSSLNHQTTSAPHRPLSVIPQNVKINLDPSQLAFRSDNHLRSDTTSNAP